MAFALIAFPALATGIVGDSVVLSIAENSVLPSADALLVFVQLLAIEIVLIFIMVKSGAIARDILGG